MRLACIDIAKALCLICMIIVHAFSYWNKYPEFNKYVGCFFLVFFYFAGGMFFKFNDIKSYIRKRIYKLIIPYLICTLAYLTYATTHKFYFSDDMLTSCKMWVATLIYSLPTSYKNVALFHVDTLGVGPIWFLVSFFMVNVLYLYISKFNHKVIISLICCVLSSISMKYFIVPFCIQSALVGVFFFSLGDVLRNNVKRSIEFFYSRNIILLLFITTIASYVYYMIINNFKYQWIDLGRNIFNLESIPAIFIGFFICILVSIILDKLTLADELAVLGCNAFSTLLLLHNMDILMIRNWNNMNFSFIISSIASYYFIILFFGKIKIKR